MPRDHKIANLAAYLWQVVMLGLQALPPEQHMAGCLCPSQPVTRKALALSHAICPFVF